MAFYGLYHDTRFINAEISYNFVTFYGPRDTNHVLNLPGLLRLDIKIHQKMAEFDQPIRRPDLIGLILKGLIRDRSPPS